MRVLITGASGFVGGALWRRFMELGFDVCAIGRRSVSRPGYVSCDLSQPLAIHFTPDIVIHAAARSSPWGTTNDYATQNVIATNNVVKFCERIGHPQLIYISTSAVLYRNEHQFDMDEGTPVPERFVNEYARTKYVGERAVSAYRGAWTIVRPRAVFGPGDTVVFPRILRAARAGRLPTIQSASPAIGDLIYVDSLVEYILRVAIGRKTGLFNLTNNQPIPIFELLGRVFESLGIPPPRRVLNVRTAMRAASLAEFVYRGLRLRGEPPITRFGVSVLAYSKTFNVAKALRELGEPSVSLDEGIDRFIHWQRGQP